MRYIVEVLPGEDERVEGSVRREGMSQGEPFCGWLELLRLLEPETGAAGGAEKRAQAGIETLIAVDLEGNAP